MDINRVTTLYCIGIKGVGMSGLAIIAKERGMDVFGSDTDEHFITDESLKKAGIFYFTSFAERNIHGALKGKNNHEILVAVTAAHEGLNNIEAVEAQKMGVRVATYGEAVGLFMSGKTGVSVAGTHGKTTTAALLAHILVKAGKDPSYLVGTSTIPSLGNAAHQGKGEYFIAEADEYVADPQLLKTPKLLFQRPTIAIITAIDWDHPDVFSSREEIAKIFVSFVNGMPDDGVVIANVDNEGVRSILPALKKKVIPYGIARHADARLLEIHVTSEGTRFRLDYHKNNYNVELSLIGVHNALNSTAALLAGLCTGVGIDELMPHMKTFTGSKRRLEKVGEKAGVLFYDDYAHHPEEIRATLQALALQYPGKRIVVIFQPHTFSRTLALLPEFSTSFASAHIVAITDIFASSREAYNPLISGEILAEQVKEQRNDVYYVRTSEDFMAQIGSKLQRDAILITMGAGDIYRWHEQIMKSFHKTTNKPIDK